MAEPIRTCVGCRKPDAQVKLVRLVLDAAGRVNVDRNRRMKGRGAWIHDSRACVEKATNNNGLPRAFKHRLQPLDAGTLWAELEAGAIGNETEDGSEHEQR